MIDPKILPGKIGRQPTQEELDALGVPKDFYEAPEVLYEGPLADFDKVLLTRVEKGGFPKIIVLRLEDCSTGVFTDYEKTDLELAVYGKEFTNTPVLSILCQNLIESVRERGAEKHKT